MMFEIISQKLPEAVEETKAGLVQMIQRMFDVDPSQRADMEAVKALKEKCIELQKKVTESDRIHTEAIKGFTETVALVRAEVQESAEEHAIMFMYWGNYNNDGPLAIAFGALIL